MIACKRGGKLTCGRGFDSHAEGGEFGVTAPHLALDLRCLPTCVLASALALGLFIESRPESGGRFKFMILSGKESGLGLPPQYESQVNLVQRRRCCVPARDDTQRVLWHFYVAASTQTAHAAY